MEFREMIEAAAVKAGSQRALAELLGEREQNVTGAKAGRRGLKDEQCAKIAELIGLRFGDVIAARNYALAREQGAKDFWRPFVDQIREAAGLTASAVAIALLMSFAPSESYANNTYNVSQDPDNPHQISDYDLLVTGNTHYAACRTYEAGGGLLPRIPDRPPRNSCFGCQIQRQDRARSTCAARQFHLAASPEYPIADLRQSAPPVFQIVPMSTKCRETSYGH